MDSQKYVYDKHTLSPQLTNRSDPRSIPDNDSVGGRGDYPGDGVNRNEQFPFSKTSKTSFLGDKYTEKPTLSDNSAEWNKADYDYNINFLYDYMVKQKQYLKHSDDKYTRNRELLVSMKTARQKDYDETTWKKSEIKRLKAETEGYEWQIRNQSALGETSSVRFSAETRLNCDLIQRKKRLNREKEFQLKKQIEEGIVPEVIDEYESAKRLLEIEQDKRQRLQKKSQWYDTELANIKEALEKHADAAANEGINLPNIYVNKGMMHSEQDKVSHQNTIAYENTENMLPGINTGKNNLVCQPLFKEDRNNNSQSGVKMQPGTSAGNEYLPQPPSMKKNGSHQRYKRKMRNAVK